MPSPPTAFGDDVKHASRPLGAPFSIVSVVRGEGIDASVPLAQGGAEQLFLDAVTAWSRNWRHAALPQLDTVALPLRAAGKPAGHVLYGHDRGRAVWFPASFTDQTESVHTVACFHRNLVLASLQVESLAHFAVATARLLDAEIELPDPYFDAARRATDVLGRFYGAVRSIYRSRSPQAQLDQGGFNPGAARRPRRK